jgi:hypothetical protein
MQSKKVYPVLGFWIVEIDAISLIYKKIRNGFLLNLLNLMISRTLRSKKLHFIRFSQSFFSPGFRSSGFLTVAFILPLEVIGDDR